MVLFSSLVPLLVVVLKRKYLNTIYKGVGLIIVAGFFTDAVSFAFLKVSRPEFAIHFNTLIEAIPIFVLFLMLSTGSKKRKLIRVLFIAYLTLHLIDLVVFGPMAYNWISKSYLCLVLTGLAVNYLVRMRFMQNNIDMGDEPLFWLMFGLAVSNFTNFPLDMGEYFLSGSGSNWLLNFYFIRMGSILLYRTLLTIAIFKIPKLRSLSL